METLKIFENPEFGKIRTITIDGEPWFVGKDVAEILGYERPSKTIQDKVDNEDKILFDQTQSQIRTEFSYKELGQRGGWIINESGLYCLILSSKLPTAKAFKKWITGTVIPSIRKYGGYVTWEKVQEFFTNPESLSDFLRQMLKIADENENLKTQLEILTPKADYFDKLMDSNHLVNFRNTATALGVRPLYFINYLVDRKYIYHNTKNEILPYQEHMQAGIFELVEYRRNGHFGVQTLITPKGRHHFLQCYFNGEMDAGLV